MSTAIDTTHVTATLGFAAAASGVGVAYVALRGADDRDGSVVRVAFRCRPLPALRGRDVAYAALHAVASRLRERGVGAAIFALDDAVLVADVREHRPVPAALTVPYVRLQCALNRFARATVETSDDRTTRDLAARARADVAFHIAA